MGSIPDYLKDLNKSQYLHDREDYSYLHGLPVRPTKRRRFIPRDESCGSGDEETCHQPQSSTITVGDGDSEATANFWWGSAFLILSLALVIGGSSIRVMVQKRYSSGSASSDLSNAKSRRKRRKRERSKKNTAIIVDRDTGNVELIHNKSTDCSVANQSLDVQLTSSEESEDSVVVDKEGFRSSGIQYKRGNELQNIKVAAAGKTRPSLPKNCHEALAIDSYFDTANDEMTELHLSRRADMQFTHRQIEQLAQRWESKGLDRQKSLEMAAYFEMNMLFFRELQHFLSATAYNLVNKLSWMQCASSDQMERHHAEILDVPYRHRMETSRTQMGYMLMNASTMTRCILVALASKLYFEHQRDILSLKNTISTIISKVCISCSTASSQTGQILPKTYLSYYGLDFSSNFMYDGVQSLSSSFLCSIKVVWYSALLLLCHKYISQSLSLIAIALIFIDWKSIIQLGLTVVIVNLFITILLCKHMDTSEKIMEARKAAKYFEQCVSLSRVLVLLPPILVGFYYTASY